MRRGITHPAIVGSHTESRGITHQACPESRRNPHFFGLFSSLNLINDSYLTESLNCKAPLDEKKRNNGIGQKANTPLLRAG
jgi:hypothetical protein